MFQEIVNFQRLGKGNGSSIVENHQLLLIQQLLMTEPALREIKIEMICSWFMISK